MCVCARVKLFDPIHYVYKDEGTHPLTCPREMQAKTAGNVCFLTHCSHPTRIAVFTQMHTDAEDEREGGEEDSYAERALQMCPSPASSFHPVIPPTHVCMYVALSPAHSPVRSLQRRQKIRLTRHTHPHTERENGHRIHS
uniref:Uncharacterized protein n=1 Tax=Vitrella brassicaformis TaxID=1169539 RepID=A0A7S1P925_9ALVE|mmetsp:Transcript_43340/g.108303  ORF Transcript_43340/g.108303 Transcript_43340/m.108303 type:complete len:140 (+) Transcript_43340:221-640(+)